MMLMLRASMAHFRHERQAEAAFEAQVMCTHDAEKLAIAVLEIYEE